MTQNGSIARATGSPWERLTGLEIGALLVLFAIVTIVLRGYTIVDLHTPPLRHIPLVLRSIDENYLAADWFVGQQSAWVGRYVFEHLMALLTRAVGLEAAYFLAHCAGVIGVSLVTYVVSVRVLHATQLAGIIAAALAVSIELIDYGASIHLVNPDLTPSVLAEPVTLLALGFALARRPVWCALAAGVASAMQPLLGIIPGALALMTLAITSVLEDRRLWPSILSLDARRLGGVLMGFAVLAIFAAFWVEASVTEIPDSDYIYIVAFIRAPHHWLPSTWAIEKHVWMAVLGTGFICVFVAWRRHFASGSNEHLAQFTIIFATAILILCLLSFVFIELVPWKTMLKVQAFRYLHLIVWLLLLIVGIVAAEVLRQGTLMRRASRGAWLLAGNMVAYAPMILVAGLLLLFRARARAQARSAWSQGIVAAVHMGLIGTLLLAPSDRHLSAVSVAGLTLVAWLTWVRSRPARVVVPVATMAILCGLVLANQVSRLPLVGEALDRLVTVDVTFDRVAARAAREGSELNSIIEVAEFAKLALPPDAVVLTPPTFAGFRIFAERAIVVDFQSLPYASVDRWYERMTHSYPSQREAMGWELAVEMDRAYREADDDHIMATASKYGATFAVLFNETATALPVLFTGNRYKLVALDEGA